FRTCTCRLNQCAGAPPWPGARSPCINIWTELSRLLMVPSVSGTTVRKECRGRRKKSTRDELWKRRQAQKSKTRLSRLAWESRTHRGISTFPKLRRLPGINLNRTFHLLQKADILMCYQQRLHGTIVYTEAVEL